MSFTHRRIRRDVISMFKIINGLPGFPRESYCHPYAHPGLRSHTRFSFGINCRRPKTYERQRAVLIPRSNYLTHQLLQPIFSAHFTQLGHKCTSVSLSLKYRHVFLDFKMSVSTVVTSILSSFPSLSFTIQCAVNNHN